MKIKMLLALQLSLWGSLLANPPITNKVVLYLQELQELFSIVVSTIPKSPPHVVAVEQIKRLLTEAIHKDNITENANLYALAALVFDDPVYRGRAISLEKRDHRNRLNTVELIRRRGKIRDNGEREIDILQDRIEAEEMFSINPQLTDEERSHHMLVLKNLKKTLRFMEGQLIVNGALKEALEKHQNTK
jgi:hypothetical protein